MRGIFQGISALVDCGRRGNFRMADGMATGMIRQTDQKKKESARRYSQELRYLRRRLNIMPLQRIPYDVAKP